jgi:uncharacterized membrane protein YedE/YeeE
VAGALIGVLSWLTFYFSRHPLGASTAYARVAGILTKCVAAKHVQSLDFYRKKTPEIDWQIMLVGGIIVGALIAAWTGDEWTGRTVPSFWTAHFGTAWMPRWGVAFLGGALMGLGARVAGGCTSGHGISGTMQLSVGSWIALICFFAGGMATAFFLYGG